MITAAERTDEPIAVAPFDVYRFKSINDDYGHQAGDAVLVALAQLMGEQAPVGGKAPMSTTGFERDKIIELLTELGRRLSDKGVAGQLYIVGGAAMALEFDTRPTTRDIDPVLHPPTTVADEATEMAHELGLPPGWLSAAASTFNPLPDEDQVSLDVEGLQVAASSPPNRWR